MAKEPEGKVTSEVKDHILKITISNPAKRNAFDPNMMPDIKRELVYEIDCAGLARSQRASCFTQDNYQNEKEPKDEC